MNLVNYRNIFILILIGLSCLFFQNCNTNPYSRGAALYKTHCENCHMSDGSGLGEWIPPLAGSDFLEQGGAMAACWIKYGLKDTIQVNGVTYQQVMPENDKLKDEEIANIVNYIHNAWGNSRTHISFETIKEQLGACSSNKK